MSKYCKNCGMMLESNANFCDACGTKVQETSYQTRTEENRPRYGKTRLAAENAKRSDGGNTGKLKKLLVPGIAFLSILIVLAIAVPRLFYSFQSSASIDGVTGQPYAGRAVTISGEGFGYYDPENSRVTIDGKDTPIISWGENEITVIVPAKVTAGKKKILLSNPPVFDKKSLKTEFLEHRKTEIASVTLSPLKDNRIEQDGFTLIVPAGGVAEEKKIVIYKYDSPAIDESPYYTVTDEYEITGVDGEHVFFDLPVFFGLEVKDEEEVLQTSYQIFDEYKGVWAKAETVYIEDEVKLYLVTDHFSGFRKFVSVMYQGSKKMAGQMVNKGKETVEYAYKKAKSAKDTVVKLTEEAYVAIKDATTEEFVGVSDADQNFIVYYRVSDAKGEPSIPDRAREMSAAFSTAYKEYKSLFGEENVPSTRRKMLVADTSGTAPSPFGIPGYDNYKVELIPDPIKVYIDPRYNKTGAVAKSATTGNIIMPSEFHEGDLASTCAHELFHAVQYHQLGLKQLYITTTGLKNLVDNSFTGNNTEIYRLFANNMWFFEATAEYAGRFIGSSEGIGAPIHKSIDASSAYYAYNGSHDYGVSSYLDYILTTQPGTNGQGEAFKEMWNTVIGNYSMLSSINVAFDEYVQDRLNESANAAYLNFWREVFTRSYMPEVDNIAGGLTDIRKLTAERVNSSMGIKENGAGIFRYNFSPSYMRKDETALTRSFWFEASPASMAGDIYRLNGLEMSDRVYLEPYEGSVNMSGQGLKKALVPYKAGESFGLIAVFYNSVTGDANIKVTLASTSLKWDNQKDIEKKVSNSTLRSSDKLKFTPTLPEQKSGDTPFSAVVTLNNNDDFKTELDKVENGKPFEVGAPMKELPPDKISVNIKIFKDGKLVHEYQSGELVADAKVAILGPREVVYELEEGEAKEHSFSAMAAPEGDYRFEWSFGDGSPLQDIKGGYEAMSTHTYSGFKSFNLKVTLYDSKDKALSSDSVVITLKKKENTSPAEPTASPSAVPEPVKEYAWILVDTHDYENADKWTQSDAHVSYIVKHSYSRGSYSASTTYEGDDPYDQGRSGTLAVSAVFSGVPDIIYPNKPVSLNLSFTPTEDSVHMLSFSAYVSADFDQWDVGPGGVTRGAIDFKNVDGESSFSIIGEQSKSFDEILTASLGTGSEGSRIALRLKLSMGVAMGTNYIYEWKQVGSSTPLLDTEGIEGIVDID